MYTFIFNVRIYTCLDRLEKRKYRIIRTIIFVLIESIESTQINRKLTGRDAAVASILTAEVNFMFDRRASLPVWMAA
jgi:hypothetical protein